jgi:hypothetical protein
MPKTKSTPNLPAASRLQPPSGGGNMSVMKAKGGMKGSTGTAKRIMKSASAKKMC